MIEQRNNFVLTAAAKALAVRQAHGYGATEAVSVYDLADKLGIEVWFTDIPSMEGMYYKTTPPRIFLSTLRPVGRQAYTCAHELGHAVFQHGTRVDELIDQSGPATRFDPQEQLADRFAEALLMPKSAVGRGFAARGWSAQSCTVQQVYTIAGWLGVGYTTLIQHMTHTLKLLSHSYARELLKITPQRLREDLLGAPCAEDVFIVDQHWSGRPIDLQVGDVLILPPDVVVDGSSLDVYRHTDQHLMLRARAQGTMTRLYQPASGWAAWTRISRRAYTGWAKYRHLEEPNDDA